MRKSVSLKRRPYILVFFSLAITLAGCSGLGLFGDPSSSLNGKAIAEKDARPPIPQRRTSKALKAAEQEENKRVLNAYGGLYTNKRVEQQLTQITKRLIEKSESPTHNFQIIILNSPAINAFALPSGYLYITRGLLSLANDASEIAAVLAHEMAHITSQHGQKRLERTLTKQLVSKSLNGIISDTSTLANIQKKKQLSLAAFTQAQEFEADLIGVQNAGLAGYDPFAAARFLEIMERYQIYQKTATLARKSNDPDFLSSHPATPQRIAQARLAARRFGAPGFGGKDKTAYLKAVDGMIFGDDPSEGFIRDRSFFHPKLKFTFSVPSGFIIENTQNAVLATTQNDDFIQFDGVEIPGNLSLTDYLGTGWFRGLEHKSIKPFTVNGAPAASANAFFNGYTYRLTIIRSGNATYRMIFATKNPDTQFERAVSATVNSFRPLTDNQARELSPLRIKIIKIKQGDTILSLSRAMHGLVTNPTDALRVLNGLNSTDEPKIGSLFKIITDKTPEN